MRRRMLNFLIGSSSWPSDAIVFFVAPSDLSRVMFRHEVYSTRLWDFGVLPPSGLRAKISSQLHSHAQSRFHPLDARRVTMPH